MYYAFMQYMCTQVYHSHLTLCMYTESITLLIHHTTCFYQACLFAWGITFGMGYGVERCDNYGLQISVQLYCVFK